MTERLETEDDYRTAMARFLEICHFPENSPESLELFHLIKLMEEYEQNNCGSD